MRLIPNFITSLNLIAGFCAVVYAAAGETLTASWLVLAAMIFDFFDGFSARLLKAYSDVGKELDSLADVVSFGVAPGLIIYNLLITSLLPVTPANTQSPYKMLIVIIPAIMPVCAALRLAIFNIDSSQTTTFKGLPTPANALAVISMIIASRYSHASFFKTFEASPLLILAFLILLSVMMISRFPLFSLKISDLKWKGNEGRFILIGLILISFFLFGIAAAPLVIPLYILSSLLAPLL